jgi:hypothetical protein
MSGRANVARGDDERRIGGLCLPLIDDTMVYVIVCSIS